MNLKEDIKKKGQIEPIKIMVNGLIAQGNRRFSVISELFCRKTAVSENPNAWTSFIHGLYTTTIKMS